VFFGGDGVGGVSSLRFFSYLLLNLIERVYFSSLSLFLILLSLFRYAFVPFLYAPFSFIL
jgi:hypothetical protein